MVKTENPEGLPTNQNSDLSLQSTLYLECQKVLVWVSAAVLIFNRY